MVTLHNQLGMLLYVASIPVDLYYRELWKLTLGEVQPNCINITVLLRLREPSSECLALEVLLCHDHAIVS